MEREFEQGQGGAIPYWDTIYITVTSHFLCDSRMWTCKKPSQAASSWLKLLQVALRGLIVIRSSGNLKYFVSKQTKWITNKIGFSEGAKNHTYMKKWFENCAFLENWQLERQKFSCCILFGFTWIHWRRNQGHRGHMPPNFQSCRYSAPFQLT